MFFLFPAVPATLKTLPSHSRYCLERWEYPIFFSCPWPTRHQHCSQDTPSTLSVHYICSVAHFVFVWRWCRFLCIKVFYVPRCNQKNPNIRMWWTSDSKSVWYRRAGFISGEKPVVHEIIIKLIFETFSVFSRQFFFFVTGLYNSLVLTHLTLVRCVWLDVTSTLPNRNLLETMLLNKQFQMADF